YIATQSNGYQIKYKDITQIDKDDIEEIDIKWNMDLLSIRADRFWKKIGKKITIQGSDVAGLEIDVVIRDNKIEYLMNELKQVKKEKERLDKKLTGFESALKDLDNLLGRQRSDKNKEGLFEFVDDTITDYRRPIPSIDASKCNKSELQSSNFSVFEHEESTGSIMSKPMIKFVKEADCPRVIKINNTENARKSTVKYAEMHRNISKGPKVRGNQRNWNNKKSQQLGNDFMMHNKACYICGNFDHL
nr:ubiquitin hydrolase [Tanacetum cinerariifolium]